MAEVKAFTDVPNVPLPEVTGKVYGADVLSNVNSLQVGSGSNVMRADQNGLWLGAEKFTQAPVRISVTGTIYIFDGTYDRAVFGNL